MAAPIPPPIATLVSAHGSTYECLAIHASAEIRRLERKYGCAWVVASDRSREEVARAIAAREAKRTANVERRIERRKSAHAAFFAEQDRLSAACTAALDAGDMGAFAIAHAARTAHAASLQN